MEVIGRRVFETWVTDQGVDEIDVVAVRSYRVVKKGVAGRDYARASGGVDAEGISGNDVVIEA